MSERKTKSGLARLGKNERDIVINLKNGEAFTINGFALIDLTHKRAASIDVLKKSCRRDRSK
jgi:hypothetical protein